MANEVVKNLIKRHRLHYYEIADELGISPGYLSTLLRKPLTEETEQKIKEAVNVIVKGGQL